MAVIKVDLQIDVVVLIRQFGVDAMGVIHLVEGIDRSFPIAVPFDGDIAGHIHLIELIRVEMAGDNSQIIKERRCIRVQIVPDETTPNVRLNLFQGQPVDGAALSKVLLIRHVDQATGQVIGPSMIRALQHLGVAGVVELYLVTAMVADIVKKCFD